MNEKQWFAGLLALTLVGGAGIWWLLRQEPSADPASTEAEASAPTADATPAPSGTTPAAPAHPLPPLPAEPEEAPLPALADSDADFLEALRGLLGAPGVAALIVPEQTIRRLVVAIDNLPRERVGLRDWPVRRSAGTLVVEPEGEAWRLARDNGARYQLAVALVKAAEPEALVRVYRRHYPLFEQAYREIGYPDGHFNDRLVQVIDHLLATPALAEPVRLVRPKVVYEFAEPAAERFSFGQKLMIRLGAENRAVVFERLRQLRRLLATGDQP